MRLTFIELSSMRVSIILRLDLDFLDTRKEEIRFCGTKTSTKKPNVPTAIRNSVRNF